jgi:hypothetical protein
MGYDGWSLSVHEFFTVGAVRRARIWYAVKGGVRFHQRNICCFQGPSRALFQAQRFHSLFDTTAKIHANLRANLNFLFIVQPPEILWRSLKSIIFCIQSAFLPVKRPVFQGYAHKNEEFHQIFTIFLQKKAAVPFGCRRLILDW